MCKLAAMDRFGGLDSQSITDYPHRYMAVYQYFSRRDSILDWQYTHRLGWLAIPELGDIWGDHSIAHGSSMAGLAACRLDPVAPYPCGINDGGGSLAMASNRIGDSLCSICNVSTGRVLAEPIFDLAEPLSSSLERTDLSTPALLGRLGRQPVVPVVTLLGR